MTSSPRAFWKFHRHGVDTNNMQKHLLVVSGREARNKEALALAPSETKYSKASRQQIKSTKVPQVSVSGPGPSEEDTPPDLGHVRNNHRGVFLPFAIPATRTMAGTAVV